MTRSATTISSARAGASFAPLIAHVVVSLDIGGLENGLLNLVNNLDYRQTRHAIVVMTQASEFRNRLRRKDVEVIEIGKKPGKNPVAYLRLFRVLKRLKPQVLHTRNLGTVDTQLLGFLARIPYRIHSEHGWDVHDDQGTRRKYLRLRRLMDPLIHQYVGLSEEICDWLVNGVGVTRSRIVQIVNGVDTEIFHPRAAPISGVNDKLVIGTVTRLNEIKDPLNVVRAFGLLLKKTTRACHLVIVGDGPLESSMTSELVRLGISDHVTLKGRQHNIPQEMRAFDLFVLGSKREGISNTILEAMASALPIVATATGGNLQLVTAELGKLAEPENPQALCEAMLSYVAEDGMRLAHGNAARVAAERHFSLAHMVASYQSLYLNRQ